MLVTAPNYPTEGRDESPRIFLAGSIEQDTAALWQDEIIHELARTQTENVTIYNPRRATWDSTLTNEITEPEFERQVMWELEHMEKADIIVMYFQPGTKSPITLLELGLHAKSHKLIVCCPLGFWRKGNVDVVCRQYGIQQAENLDELVTLLLDRLSTARLTE